MDAQHVIEVSEATFAADVIERSRDVPVLVDFWADWCNPCHMLMPVLAKLAEEADGAFVLAKVNTDQQQSLAMQFGVRSLPTVKLFRDGEVVDEFMGVLPETHVRAFLDRHLSKASDHDLAAAQASAAAGDIDAALAQAASAHQNDPENMRVTQGYLALLQQAQHLDQIEQVISTLPAAQQQDDAVQNVQAWLEFSRIAETARSAAELQHSLESDPSDSESRFQLAAVLIAHGELVSGLELLFELFRSDRKYGDDAARKALLSAFKLAGDGPEVAQYRRRMASLLH